MDSGRATERNDSEHRSDEAGMETPARTPVAVIRRVITRSPILAAVGVLSVAGVAAAAAGAPVPVFETAFDDDGPELVEVETSEVEETETAEETETVEEAEAVEGEEVSQEDGDTEDQVNPVSEAAQSDCFKKDKNESAETDGEEAAPTEAQAAEVTEEDADAYVCPEGDYKNHGQFVRDVAHQRNAERKAAKCAEMEGEAGEKCTARLEAKADRDAARAEAKAQRDAAKAERKAAGGDDDGVEAESSDAKGPGNGKAKGKNKGD